MNAVTWRRDAGERSTERADKHDRWGTGAELVLQLHLGRQLVKQIPLQARHMIGNSVAEAYEQMQKDAKHSATSTPERV